MPDKAPETQGAGEAHRGGRLWSLLRSRLVAAVFKIALAAAILVYLVRTDRLNFSTFHGPQVSPLWIAVSVLVTLPSLAIVSWRFWIILGALGLPASFGRALQWTMVGEFFNVAMPGATGGDVIKAVYLARAYGPGRRSVAVLGVLLDRVVGLFGLFCFALLVCLAGGHAIEDNPRLTGLTRVLALVCAVGIAAFFVVVSRAVEESRRRQALVARLPMGEKLEKVYRGLAGLRRRPGTLALILGLSLINHAFWAVSLLALSRGLGMDFSLLDGLVVIPLALFLNTFGVAGGFGVGEAAFEALFTSMLGTGRGVGAGLAFAYHVLTAALRFCAGLPFYIAGRAPSRRPTEPAT